MTVVNMAEVKARVRKAELFADIFAEHHITSTLAGQMPAGVWELARRVASARKSRNVTAPSEATQALVVSLLAQREKPPVDLLEGIGLRG